MGWFFSVSREPGMFLSQQVLWGPTNCSALHVPLILTDQGAVEKPLPAYGKLNHGIWMKSISKLPYLAFRLARPLPTTLSKY